jgi:hypothetical protein
MSQGAVFHPGHDNLHGITVVLYTDGPRTYVGRWDQEEGGFIAINSASMHDTARDAKPRDQWLADTKTYGVAVQFPRLTVPRKEVTRVVKLGDLEVAE